MEFKVDYNKLDADIKSCIESLDAVANTLNVHGRAEVVCSRRVKLPWEKRKTRTKTIRVGDTVVRQRTVIRSGRGVPNGWVIANMLTKQGHDPFVFPSGQDIEVANIISEEIADSVEYAARTKTPAPSRVRAVLSAAAAELAEVSRTRIISGGLGTNVGKWGKRKARLIGAGYGLKAASGKRGYWTGRFVNGIRWRWRQGFRPGGE